MRINARSIYFSSKAFYILNRKSNVVGDSDTINLSEVRDCGKLIQWIKERGILQMCCFVILLLFKEMQMSMTCFSAIPHLRH